MIPVTPASLQVASQEGEAAAAPAYRVAAPPQFPWATTPSGWPGRALVKDISAPDSWTAPGLWNRHRG